jgi:hypothetical protein
MHQKLTSLATVNRQLVEKLIKILKREIKLFLIKRQSFEMF